MASLLFTLLVASTVVASAPPAVFSNDEPQRSQSNRPVVASWRENERRLSEAEDQTSGIGGLGELLSADWHRNRLHAPDSANDVDLSYPSPLAATNAAPTEGNSFAVKADAQEEGEVTQQQQQEGASGEAEEEADEREAAGDAPVVVGEAEEAALQLQQQEQREQEGREEGAAGSELLPVRDACVFAAARGQFVLVERATRIVGFRFTATDAWRPPSGKRRRTGDCRFAVDDTCSVVHAGGCDDGNTHTSDECDWSGASFTIVRGGAIKAEIDGATVQPPASPCAPFPRCLFSAATCAHNPVGEPVESPQPQGGNTAQLPGGNAHSNPAFAAATTAAAVSASDVSMPGAENRAATFRSGGGALHVRSLGSFFPGGEEAVGANGGGGGGGSLFPGGAATPSSGGAKAGGGQAWLEQHGGGGGGVSAGSGVNGGSGWAGVKPRDEIQAAIGASGFANARGNGGSEPGEKGEMKSAGGEMKSADAAGGGMKARGQLGSGMGGMKKDLAQTEQSGGTGNADSGGSGGSGGFKRTMGGWGGAGGDGTNGGTSNVGAGEGGFKSNPQHTGSSQLTSGTGFPSNGQTSGFKSGGFQANQQQPRQQPQPRPRQQPQPKQQQANQPLMQSRQAPAGGNQMKSRLPGTGGGGAGSGGGGGAGGGVGGTRPNPSYTGRNGFKGRNGQLIPAPPAPSYNPTPDPTPDPIPNPPPRPTPNPNPYPEPDPGPDPEPLPDYPDDPQPNPASPGYFSVLRFGAVANGWSDDSGAFRRAFAAACGYGARTRQRGMVHVAGGKVFRIFPMEVQGPCGAGLIVRIDGAIQAFYNTAAYPQPESSKTWAMLGFDGVDNLAVAGRGYMDGAGQAWWGKGKRPMLIHVSDCRNLLVSGITFRNPGKIHMKVKTSTGVVIRGVRTLAPWNSPNTDSISISSSSNVVIRDSRLESGDDGVGIVGMTRNVLVENVTCINGHGISIGSLGAEGALGCIQGVTVRDVTLRGSNNGLRIKTYQGGVGLVSNVSYENVHMVDVTYPIIINQFYCDTKNVDASKCVPQLNAVAIRDISFNGIQATCNGTAGIVVNCSSSVPCQEITLSNVRVVPSAPDQSPLIPSYANAYGSSGWNVVPRPVGALYSLRAGQPGPAGRLSFSSVASQCHAEVWTQYEQGLKQQRSVRIGGIRNSRTLGRV